MNYQFYRIQRKPIVLGRRYEWEKITDEQVIETFGKDSGVQPQRLAATIARKQPDKMYRTLSWTFKIEEIPE